MFRIILATMIFVLSQSSILQASLWDRGGGLIYDDVLDITWLQDANYSLTSGYDDDGRMTWSQAVSWVESLSYYDPIRDTIWDDWRLPHTLPVNGSFYDYSTTYDGMSDNGYNISAPMTSYAGSTGSEMAYMYYNNLQNKSYFDFSGIGPQPGYYDHKTSFESGGPGGEEVFFTNLSFDVLAVWWSETEYTPNSDYAWLFAFYRGGQGDIRKEDYSLYSWAVRDGDVTAVPMPGTIWLFGTGIVLIAGFRSKRWF